MLMEFGNLPDTPDMTISSSGVNGYTLEVNFICSFGGIGGNLSIFVRVFFNIVSFTLFFRRKFQLNPCSLFFHKNPESNSDFTLVC